MNKKIFVYDYACELRSLDSTKICKYLSKNNHELVSSPKNADVIFFITCAVHNQIANNVLKKIKEFQKYNAELIVAGCLPAIEKEKLADIFDGKTLITKDLENIDTLFPENKIKFKDMCDENILYQTPHKYIFNKDVGDMLKEIKWIRQIYRCIMITIGKFNEDSILYNFSTKKPVYYLRTSFGCRGNCTYCAIKKAIGPFKSKPVDECIKEFKKGLQNGYVNFILAADDSGSYGLDIKSNLAVLLQNLINIPGQYEMAIREISPQWIVKYIDELENICKERKIVNLGIVIQSGNSRILKLMNRYSDINKIKDAIKRLKNSYPCLKINTHIIVGFPTETEDEFKQTLSFVEEINFDSGLVFPFSCKTGTEAEKIEPKISQEEIARRLKYAKKFLKNIGYNVFCIFKRNFLFFEKGN